MNNKNEIKKIAIFDLDETIGYFPQLYIIWNSLIKHSKKKLNLVDFYKLCDIFSCYFRPEIIEIMISLRKNKILTVIYTNNCAPKWWAQSIITYINYKTAFELGEIENKSMHFIKTIIGAFNINGIINDRRRTTNEKTYKDIQRIFGLTPSTKVLFIDDLIHPKMIEKNIYYLKVSPYKNNLFCKKIFSLFFESDFGKLFIIENKIKIQDFMNFVLISIKKHNIENEFYNNNNNNLIELIEKFINI